MTDPTPPPLTLELSVDDAPDAIARCIVEGGVARVVAVISTGIAQEAARRHEAESAAAVALARALTSSLLLATLTKDDERVTLQILGDGPLGGITADARASGTARAYVRNADVALAPANRPAGGRARIGDAVGRRGLVNVIRDVGMRENLSGQTAIATGEIDEDVAQYLMVSEQIESALACEVVLSEDGALVASAGLLVQALPGGEGVAVVREARALLAGDGGPSALLRALASSPVDVGALVAATFAERLGAIRLLDVRPVAFHCPCSRERAGASLALLGPAELASMILEDGKAEVICNFCRAKHDFTDGELEAIRRGVDGPAGPPS
jgi:molecular chaperone Hsp33